MKSDEVVLRARGVSKKFSRSLRHSMWYGLTEIAKSTIGWTRRNSRLRPTEFWALRDVSLELRRGEALGVIGKNGSGKSTLLSLLNGIFRPDEGQIEVNGRVGALIQLGAGFHPLLSGRENIYVNAAILGMSKREVNRKLDEIIAFAGIEEFIDAPVRSYSSGMFARLGFSVAVHTEPDILLVDEVLSVGDAEFRARAMERMWQMREQGVSVIFVSHNMLSVSGFCNRLMLLEKGIAFSGSGSELISRYFGRRVDERYNHVVPAMRHQIEERRRIIRDLGSGDIEILSTELFDVAGDPRHLFAPEEAVRVIVRFRALRPLSGVLFTLELHDPTGLIIWAERSWSQGPVSVDGEECVEIRIEPIQLKTGSYLICASFSDFSLEGVYVAQEGTAFEVREPQPNPGGNDGLVVPQLTWLFRGVASPARPWLESGAPNAEDASRKT